MADKITGIIDLSYAITVLIILLTFVLIGFRIRAMWLQKRVQHVLRKHQDYFDYVKSNMFESTPLQKPIGSIHRAELLVIQGKLLNWMEKIVGAECDRLTELCRDLGLVDLNMRRLQNEIHWIRLDAAYNLGIMQAKEATPALLQLLEEERYGTSAFVIARSISKCAQDVNQLDRMVRILAKHSKQSHRLVTSMLVLSRLDWTPLLLEYLNETDEQLVKIALTSLQTRSLPGTEDMLSSLMGAEDSELRLLAVQAMVHQGTRMTPEQMNELMRHEDADVRAEAADAFGQVGMVASVDSLKEGLEDSDRRVRYNSARSLVDLDSAGFAALCEVALHGSNSREVTLASNVIQEELSNGPIYSEDLEQAIRHNMRLDIYRRYFGGHEADKQGNLGRVKVLKGDTA
jgi:HEAT repeat protein